MSRPKTLVFIVQPPTVRTEDSGAARILDVEDDYTDPHVWVAITSYDGSLEHPTMRGWEGKRLRVTIEAIE